MSDHDLDLPAARRNLMVIATAVLFVMLSGAEIKPHVNLLGLSINFHRPWMLHVFLFAGLSYAVVRFASLSKEPREIFREQANSILISSDYVRSVAADIGHDTETTMVTPEIQRGFFKRKLHYLVPNGAPEGHDLQLSFWRLIFEELRADIEVASRCEDFIENHFPLLYGNLILALNLIFWYWEFVRHVFLC